MLIKNAEKLIFENGSSQQMIDAGMVELADSVDLGSSVERRAGSSPVTRTNGDSSCLLIIERICRKQLFHTAAYMRL